MSFLYDLIETAKVHAEKTAVVSAPENKSYTYSELLDKAKRTATKLVQNGVMPGDFVAIELPRTIEYVPSMLGVWMIGAAFTALDSSYPAERLSYIENDCKAKIIINEKFLADIDNYDVIASVYENLDDDNAILVYTSGSTGNPKGVLHNHRSFFNSVNRFIKFADLKEDDIYSLGAPFTFIAGMQGVFGPSMVGAATYITPNEARKDPRILADYLYENNITKTFLSPKILKLFKSRGGKLRRVLTGSEKVTDAYSDDFEIAVIYGSTESCGGVLSFKPDKAYENTPIGKPIGNEKVYILDDEGNEAEEGEICLSGHFASCYLGLSELSSKVFIDNPFKDKDGYDKMLRTGDIGRILPDGNVLYLNRKDWMVKINGQRVEPGEIESVIRSVDGVADAAVKDFTNQYGQVYLCGYYTESKSVDADAIKNAIEEKLPHYMMPAFLIRLDKMPVNANGKLDRKALMKPDASMFKSEYTAPKTDEEKLICNAYEQVLGIDKVGIDDDFFALGGDSIKTVMLADICSQLSLSSVDVFTAKTPRKLALLGAGKKTDYSVFDKNAKEAELTDSQMGVYLECVSTPEGLMYNIPVSYRFDAENIDTAKLEAAIRKATESFTAFSACVKSHDGKVFVAKSDDDTPVITVKKLSEADIENEMHSFVRPFKLDNEKLYRFEIVKTEKSVYVLFDIHHIVFDGSSVQVLNKAISDAYNGNETAAENVNMYMLSQYERSDMAKLAAKKDEEYFEGYIGGIETDSNLPIDKPDNKNEGKCGKVLAYTGAGTAEITKYAKSIGVTEGSVFLGAFAYALAKYTCQNEAMFCTASNGRHDSQLKGTIGMLVRTLPFYTKVDEEENTSDYLIAVQNNFFETMKHDSASFGSLARSFGVRSDIMFVYQSDMLSGFSLGGHYAELCEIEVPDCLANISVMVIKKNNSYEIKLSYNSSIYDTANMQRFAKCIADIASDMINAVKLSDIRLASDEDIKLIDSFNATECESPEAKPIGELFRAQAKKTPDNNAVVYLDKKITYKELDRVSDNIAAFLHDKGIGKGDFVSILIPRCELMPVISLGITKSGAAYQPLDPSYPQDRLNFMVNDAASKLVIADKELSEVLTEYSGEFLFTDSLYSLPDKKPEIPEVNPADAFIILYTSGTTGVPKGCILEHRNIAAFVEWFAKKCEITADTKSAAYASFGFDANMMDMYPTLLNGGELHIIAENIRLNINAIEKYFNDNGITNSFMTTQVGRQFAVTAKCPKLKFLLVGGEKLVPTNPPENTRFFNLYGPTETTVSVTSYEVISDSQKLPIGVPNDNTKLYVLDKYNRTLPIGAMGELCISGIQVSRGYLNRPDVTEKVFVKNPFGEGSYSRMYRTGDIVRWLDDGNIEFIGRRDGQVKVRGFRIELTEVEKIIREFDGIKDATVAAFDAPAGGKFIAAYIVADEKIDIDALNSFILENKPPYMVPAVTMQIDAIPLNVNSKVDKRKLPAPVFTENEEENGSSRKKTKFEQEIMNIIDSALHCGEIGVTAKLINHGLTSISAITVLSLLEDKFGCEIPVSTLLNGASITDIEDIIFENWMAGGTVNKTTEEPENKEMADYYPLTSVQLGIYYDAMKRPDDIMYNIPLCISFESIDADKLAKAAETVINAHSYINTHIEIKDGKLVQIRNNDVIPTVKVKEMSENEAKEYQNDFVQPFDVHKDILYRMEVVKTESHVYFLMDVHHIVFDGMSTDLFINDLKTAYETGNVEKEKYTYFDYAADEEKNKNSEKYNEAKQYFDDLFKSYEAASEIPTDKAGRDDEGVLAYAHSMISKEKVESFCKKSRITPATLFLAAAFYATSRFSGEKSTYISTISSGRSKSKIRRCAGMFVHTIPLAMNFEEDMDISSLLRKSADVMLSGIENEDYPFSEISAKYGYNTSVMYECQLGVIDGKADIAGNEYKLVPLKLDVPKFKIAIVAEEKDGDISVTIRYNNAVYTEEYMQTLASSVKECAEQIMSLPQDSSAKHISLLSDEQRKTIDSFGCIAEFDVPIKTLHKVFENTAKQFPDKDAIVACDRTYTFKQLDEAANVVANNLIRKGVGRGNSVALLLPRKSYFFVCLMGVLKSGAAFIPCDPEYPADRINHIITDSDASFIITTDEHLADYPAEKAINVDDILIGDNISCPDAGVTPTDLAYMIYTSGSTGKPKGVMLHHHGICNYIYPHPSNIIFDTIKNTADMILSVTTVSFDMSLKEHIGPLCNGKTVVFADESQMNDPRALSEMLEKTGADIINATPSRLMQYMSYEPFRKALSQCHVILSGGEMYPISLRDNIKKVSDARILNTYGPTEITVSSNGAELTNADYVSVGRPLPNYKEYIVDSDGNLLPPGVIGELYIGGVGVARGYKNLEQMTAERFVEYAGGRIYKSGDYAKWDKNGNVIILGRKDNQVKLRGLRIELGEIEGLIAKQPYITKVVVIVRKLNGQDNLCAYFTADKVINIDELKNELKKHLTHYMVPTAYLQMDAMPVTPNGKTDIKNLPEPVSAGADEYVAPSNDVEEFFCNLFKDTLGLENKVSAEDSFFDIGGTSLVVTTIVIKAEENGYNLTYGDVFKYTTPKMLASLFVDGAVSDTSILDFDRYDYSRINEVLAKNNIESFVNGKQREIGNILLTGATGYMGAHLLAEFLKSESGKAYCLVRKGRFDTAAKRLKSIMHYYFEKKYDDALDARVEVVNGDVTSYKDFEAFENCDINTVFNCAANVKHFSSGTDIEDINIGGANNCIRLCEKIGARLIHFSTTSVSGSGNAGKKYAASALSEQTLYYGQGLDTKYTSSKLMAERNVLEAVAERNLDAKIIRVGTLAPREEDGEFQINYLTNNFIGRLRSYMILGCFPYSMYDNVIRMGPIDTSATAFLKLARTPSECCVFNAVNNHTIPLGDIIRDMNASGIDIKFVEDIEFGKALIEAEKDQQKASILSSMLAYKNMSKGEQVFMFPSKSDYTTQILARMGFFWDASTTRYVTAFIDGLAGFGFFDSDNLNR